MSEHRASLLDHLKSWPLAILPHQMLSRIVRLATRWQARWWKNPLIRLFVNSFNVDMSEAAQNDASAYPDFNAFFTRALKHGARPMPSNATDIACPVDGRVSQAGRISEQRILQAKGHDYSLITLLGGDAQRATPFSDGEFATLYLSPRDYHRIHMPVSARLLETVYIPGRLYSVAPHTTRAIPGLFARNERLVCVFDTACGPMAMVLVGAIFVSCMETVWSGVVNPRLRQAMQSTRHDLPDMPAVQLDRGAEMGRFNMGSTVILLYGPNQVQWTESLAAGAPVLMGQAIGTVSPRGK
jgi:phosphatidylserine decarboxylase